MNVPPARSSLLALLPPRRSGAYCGAAIAFFRQTRRMTRCLPSTAGFLSGPASNVSARAIAVKTSDEQLSGGTSSSASCHAMLPECAAGAWPAAGSRDMIATEDDMDSMIAGVIDAMNKNRERFVAFCESLEQRELDRAVPDSTWIVRDFAAHLDTLDV